MTEILSLVAMFIPLFVIAWTANLAEARRQNEQTYNGLALVSYIFLIVLYAAGVLLGLIAHAGAFVATANPSVLASLGADLPFSNLALLGLGMWLPSLLGILLLVPAVRKLIARFTALDPQSPVHAIALSLSMLVLINLFVTLGVGLGNLADMMASSESEESNTLVMLWGQQILTALLAMVGVGWLTRRSLGETLDAFGDYSSYRFPDTHRNRGRAAHGAGRDRDRMVIVLFGFGR